MFSMFRKNKLDLSTPSRFKESIVRASGDLGSLFDTKVWQEISKKEDPRAYMEVIESLALSGSSGCQELLVQWNLMICEGHQDKSVLKSCLRKAIKFGELAAGSGVTREALNVPISIMKLAGILVEESDGYFTDEIKDLFRATYSWSIYNSENEYLSFEERESAAELAKKLYEGSPELFEATEPEDSGSDDISEAVSLGRQCAEGVCQDVDDVDVIYQLILEDVEGAAMGNEKAKRFAQNSGISPSEYNGALNNSRPEVDGPKGVKTYLDEMAFQFYPDLEKVADFRLAATDYIMEHFRVGKYSG